MNPRREAEERLGGRYEVRVLEPSPPALEGNADDPSARGDVPSGRELVSPLSDGDIGWDSLARDDADLASWCADRWLGAWKPLAPSPPNLVETRLALHRVAEEVVSPARRIGTGGEISLRYTHGGFGTPFFADDRQVRVEGSELVIAESDAERRAPLTSLRDAALAVGSVDAESLSEDPLSIDPDAAEAIGDWFGFTTLVIAELRAGAGSEPGAGADSGLEASVINLWPEHFDISAELGSEPAGQRAGYGGSPGDPAHNEPYVYVTPWTETPPGELWNATEFNGAALTYAELLAVEDQVALAVDFLSTRLQALTAR